jgi:hypothetical protein
MSIAIIDARSRTIQELESSLDSFEPHSELEPLLLLRILSSEFHRRLDEGGSTCSATAETRNYLLALDMACGIRVARFGLDGMQVLHGLLAGRSEATPFRKTSVAMRAKIPGARLRLTGSTPDAVVPRLDDIVTAIVGSSRLGRVEKIAFAYFELIRTHPFEDGNGRVCRLLLTAALRNEFSSQVQLGIVNLIRTNFHRYNGMIRNQDASVYAQWLHYFAGMIIAEFHAVRRLDAGFRALSTPCRHELLTLANNAIQALRTEPNPTFALPLASEINLQLAPLYLGLLT